MSADKHVEAFRKTKLEAGEEVVAAADGYIGSMMGKGKDAQHNGALIVTGARVAFYRKGLLGEVFETIPLRSITSVEQKSFMGHRTLRLHTSHDALEFKSFNKAEYDAVVAAVERGRGAAGAASPPTTPTGGAGPLETIQQLGALKAAGLISEQEFEAKKAELLARL